MNKKILKIAKEEFQNLSRDYDMFINVFVDNWRGYRFVFDTEEVENCKNNCKKCRLYNILKSIPHNKNFSPGLYLSNRKDRELFGKQKYLNCKTFTQYVDCYANFIIKEVKNEQSLLEELKLIRGVKLIYSKNDLTGELFKKKIGKKVLGNTSGWKYEYLRKWFDLNND